MDSQGWQTAVKANVFSCCTWMCQRLPSEALSLLQFYGYGSSFFPLEVMARIHLFSRSVQGRRMVSLGLLLPAPAAEPPAEVHRLGCPRCTSWGCPALNGKGKNCVAFLPAYSSRSLTGKLSPPNTDVVYTTLSKGSAPNILCLFNLKYIHSQCAPPVFDLVLT